MSLPPFVTSPSPIFCPSCFPHCPSTCMCPRRPSPQQHHLQLLCSLSPQLHPMPLRNLLFQHLIHHLMLLNHRQALELCRLDFQRIHGATATAYVLHLSRHHLRQLGYYQGSMLQEWGGFCSWKAKACGFGILMYPAFFFRKV